MTALKTHRCLLYEQKRTNSWTTSNALQAELNAFHINNSYCSPKHWEFEIICVLIWKKILVVVSHSRKHRWHLLPKNIFIIKAGYNRKLPDSMIDYKQRNSTPECIWGVCVRGRKLDLGPVVLWECSPSWLAGFLILSEVIWWNRQKHRERESSITQTMWWGRALWGVTTASAQRTVCSAFTCELWLTRQFLMKD